MPAPEIITNCEQGSEEWHSLRLGSIGGSSISKIMAKGRGGSESKMREDLKYQFAKEIITGKRDITYYNKNMENGHIFEPKARAFYEWRYSVKVQQVAVIRSAMPRVHVSPDGLVSADGGLEIKCMKDKVFLEFLDKEIINGYHIKQCQQFLSVSGRTWIDYVVYCPELDETNEDVLLPDGFRGIDPLWVKRLTRDEEMISLIEAETVRFLKELDELLARLLCTHKE